LSPLDPSVIIGSFSRMVALKSLQEKDGSRALGQLRGPDLPGRGRSLPSSYRRLRPPPGFLYGEPIWPMRRGPRYGPLGRRCRVAAWLALPRFTGQAVPELR